MRFDDHLYVGDKAKKHRFSILQGIREEKLQPEVYVITPSEYGNNLYEIFPSAVLLLPPYRGSDYLVCGIAVTYWEALEVVRQMVDDRYQQGSLTIR